MCHCNNLHKILIVEDNEATQILIQEILEYLDVELIITGRAEEAIRLYESHYKEIVLVLLDLRLPNCNGRDLLKNLRAINPDVVAIAVSALRLAELATEAKVAGFNDWIEKPFDLDEFVKMVKRYL
ncbi:MAG TPA: response regulator [Bacteroidales bacterium]